MYYIKSIIQPQPFRPLYLPGDTDAHGCRLAFATFRGTILHGKSLGTEIVVLAHSTSAPCLRNSGSNSIVNSASNLAIAIHTEFTAKCRSRQMRRPKPQMNMSVSSFSCPVVGSRKRAESNMVGEG